MNNKTNIKTSLTIFVFLLVMMVLLAGATSVYGRVPTILLVSDCSAPGTYTGAPPNDVPERDNSLVSFLEGLGYTVDTSGMNKAYQEGQIPFNDPAKLGALNAADLVLVSRQSNSGDYDDDRQNWNELEKPLLLMSGCLTRGGISNRWGWTTGGSGNTSLTQTDIVIEAGQMGHPFVAGFTTPITAFDWSSAPTPGQAPKTVFLPDSAPVEGVAIIGTFDNKPILMDIPAGTDFDANNTDGPYGIAGGRRALLATWGYDIDLEEPSRPATFTDFLTVDYLDLFAQTLSILAPRELIIYVDDDATGLSDGTSWGNAYNYLQDALAIALWGDEIRVAQGIYKPDQGAGITPGRRSATFYLKTGVAIYGSYAGFGAQDPDERDPNMYETILSGDIGTVDDNTDNSYHVVTGAGSDATAILEGFTITGGNAYQGGGMHNSGSSPTVKDCNFSNNSAAYGGGMCNLNGSDPNVTDCTFTGNTVSVDGGGMYNRESSPTITNCTFSSNMSNWGAGMYNYTSNSTVTNCTFINNSASSSGGGMLNQINSLPTVTNCTFINNTANGGGGGMCNLGFGSSPSSPTVTNCIFTSNAADYGGGMYSQEGSSPTVTDCNFSGNSASDEGGGMFNNVCDPNVTNCTFSGNTADGVGGAMRNWSSNPNVSNCDFTANSADHAGGMFNDNSSSPTVTNCTFSSNSATGIGGGMYNLTNSSPRVTNCTFSGNSAGSDGGGMDNRVSSNPNVTNCTFSNNSATGKGGGMDNYQSSPTVTNCILWSDWPDELFNSFSTPIVTYSDVQGGTGQSWFGTGCIDADPGFVDVNNPDPNLWNLRLVAGSPCIDAGNNTAVPVSVLKDLDGKLRYADDPCTPDTGNAGMTGRPVVDMGAYEFQGSGTTLQNLLANPGFEVGDATGWVTNWGFSLTADTNQVHDGNYSGLASNRTASWQGAWQSLLGLMDDGRTYRISGWVRLENATSDYVYVALTVAQTDSAGAHYHGIDNATGYDDQWVHLDGTLALDVVGELTGLHIYFEGPAPDVNFYVDDAAVTEVMGDMNHNGGVDFIDFSLFASYYGFDCSTQDCGRANLDDSDNTINERDLAILCNNWLAGTEP